MPLFRPVSFACLCLASSLMAVLFPAAPQLAAKTVHNRQEMEIFAVGGGDEGYSYFLYLDRDHDKCVDALPSSADVKMALDRAVQRSSLANFRVKARVKRIKGFPATIQLWDKQLIVSSAGGIRRNGRQIFLDCQDFLSNKPYQIYFVEEVKDD